MRENNTVRPWMGFWDGGIGGRPVEVVLVKQLSTIFAQHRHRWLLAPFPETPAFSDSCLGARAHPQAARAAQRRQLCTAGRCKHLPPKGTPVAQPCQSHGPRTSRSCSPSQYRRTGDVHSIHSPYAIRQRCLLYPSAPGPAVVASDKVAGPCILRKHRPPLAN